MLEHFFDRSSRIQSLRDGLGGPLLEKFANELWQAGYAEITARRYIRSAEHLLYWTDKEGIPISSLAAQTLERFSRHLEQCQCPRYGHSQPLQMLSGARLFLNHLRGTGVITSPVVEPAVQDPVLLSEFCQWMHRQRGTSSLTLYNYSLSLRDLLKQLGENPARFNARSLRQFVLEKSQTSGWATAKKCTTALRMFLRFLIAKGECAAGLDEAIPVLAHWRLSNLPRYMQPEEVELILDSCDLNSPVGRRDRAILLLLARLGLRAGDIVTLRLGDIDWQGAWLYVSGKGHRQTRLPLTQETGSAVADYLQDGRPPADTDVLFIRSRAPFRAFTSHCAISVIVDRAIRRAGVTRRCRGAAHVLRHSAATSMLRQGASLQDIAVILRHRCIETTEIYAKVDVTTLRQIAQCWPEVLTC